MHKEVSQRLFEKHADGIETIEESEPKFEQSQRIDLTAALEEAEEIAVRAETEAPEPQRAEPIFGHSNRNNAGASKPNLSSSRFQTIQQPPRRNHLTTSSYQSKAEKKPGYVAPARVHHTPTKKPAPSSLHQRNKTTVVGQPQQSSNEKPAARQPGNARSTSALSSSRSVFAGRGRESKPVYTNRYAKGS